MAQDLPEGTVLAGRYAIDARIGDGAMGVVYQAHHVKVGRPFAIKVLHDRLTGNAQVRRRFEREAELAGRLCHTNVAAVVDVGVADDGVHFIAMELASGTALDRLLADGPLSETRVLDLAKQVCAGLQHAHDHGLIHRDLKPENVIVEPLPGGREVARIVDWGVAILREDATDVDTEGRLTTKGIVVGTPHYMSPEQARGDALDARTDLFSLGLVCYELLTGLLPFDGSGVDVARAYLTLPIPPIRERAPDVHVDPVLEAVIMRLLARSRDERPGTANAALELLELYERDRHGCALLLGVSLPQPVDPERDRDTEKVHTPAPRRLVTTMIALVAALGIIFTLGLRDDTRHATVAELATFDVGEPVAPLAEIAVVAVTTAAPALRPAPAAPPPRPIASPPPSAAEIATLYARLGRELEQTKDARGMASTIELWPRYRWIRIHDWLATPERRAEVAVLLERLRADLHESR